MRLGTFIVLVLWCFTSGCSDDLTEDTNTISSLMVWKAEKLVRQYQGDELSLNGLTTLTRSQAEALAQHEGLLILDGLTNMPPDIADALAQHNGPVSLDGLTNLTPDTAQALARGKNFLSLDGLTTLAPNVADALAQHSSSLSLDGLTEIDSILLAKKLVNRNYLDLSGLRKLSAEVAVELARHKGTLYLNGLTALPPDVAAILARHKGTLSLNGLTEITSILLAEKLVEQKNTQELVLDGLIKISQEVASSLAQYEGDLSLDGLTTLSPVVSLELSRHEGYLSLSGLTTLTYQVAESLSRHKDTLDLSGITTLTPNVAALLATHQGDKLFMDHLQDLQDGQLAAKLADSWALWPPNEPDSALSPMLFDSLQTISEEAAAEIVKRKTVLLLNGLKSLTPPLAKILATHEGTLNLSGIEEINAETAETLSQHTGLLHLTGLLNITNTRVAKALAEHRRCILLSPTVDMTVAAREIFNESPQIVGYGYGSSQMSHALVEAYFRMASGVARENIEWSKKELNRHKNIEGYDTTRAERRYANEKRKLTAMIEEYDTLADYWGDDSRSYYSMPTDSGFVLLDEAGLFQVSYQFEERLQDGNEYDDLYQRIPDGVGVLNNIGTTAPAIIRVWQPYRSSDSPGLNPPIIESNFAIKELTARILELKYAEVREEK